MLRGRGSSRLGRSGKTRATGGSAVGRDRPRYVSVAGQGLRATMRVDEVVLSATRDQARDLGTIPYRWSSEAFNGGVSWRSSLPPSSDPSPRRYRFLRPNRDRRPENGQHFAAVRLDPVPQVGECIRLARLHTRMRAREPARAVPGSRKSGFSPSPWCHHDITARGVEWMLKQSDGSLPIRPDRASPSPTQHPGGHLQPRRKRGRIWSPAGDAAGLGLGD